MSAFKRSRSSKTHFQIKFEHFRIELLPSTWKSFHQLLLTYSSALPKQQKLITISTRGDPPEVDFAMCSQQHLCSWRHSQNRKLKAQVNWSLVLRVVYQRHWNVDDCPMDEIAPALIINRRNIWKRFIFHLTDRRAREILYRRAREPNWLPSALGNIW